MHRQIVLMYASLYVAEACDAADRFLMILMTPAPSLSALPTSYGIDTQERLANAMPGVATIGASFALDSEVVVAIYAIIRGERHRLSAAPTSRAFFVEDGASLELHNLELVGESTSLEGNQDGGLVFAGLGASVKIVGSSLSDRGVTGVANGAACFLASKRRLCL